MGGTSKLVRAAMVDADDRQRALNEVCRGVLKDFVGKDLTPTLLAEAEALLRSTLDEAIRAGKYVLPDGLVVDRVELGVDMRIKVVFARADQVIDEETGARLNSRIDALAAELADLPAEDR